MLIGSFLNRLIQRFVLSVITHPGMDHVLVDNGQFLGQTDVQMVDDLFTPFHA
jgi:hypothetical protein